MDTTVRNLDENAYRALRARAVLEGRTVGALMTEAIRGYLARPSGQRPSSLRRLRAEAYPPGSGKLSLEIDEIVYGNRK
jgi:plasmid stability protein